MRVARRHHRVSKFALVGVVNTAIDFSLYVVLVTLGLPILVANLISTSAGMTFSFFGNRSFVFKDRQGHPVGHAVRFLVVTLAGLWLLQPVLLLIVTAALDALAPSLAMPVTAGLAKFVAISAGVVWNYVLYNRFVFRARPVGPVVVDDESGL